MKTKGYSILLVPNDKKAYRLYYQTIKKLSKQHHTPLFNPHITLLGSITGQEKDIVTKTGNLAQELKPCLISFDNLGMEQFFFRSLYLEAKPTKQLLQTNQKAGTIFGTNFPFMPHLSLLYSNLSDRQKRAIITSLESQQWPDFTVDALHLYKCDGEVEDWHEVLKAKFKKT